jgi:NADH-quinone oxidoreductase subunit E
MMVTAEATRDDVSVRSIILKYPGRDQDLMAVLQDIQADYNYLPKEALKQVSREMRIPLGQIYSVATFYNAFSIEPKGKHQVCVCTGTACHVKGAARLIESFEREIGIRVGQTSPDFMFSLEEVRCIGCCGLAPAVTIGEKLHGKLSAGRVRRIVEKYRKAEAKGESHGQDDH